MVFYWFKVKNCVDLPLVLPSSRTRAEILSIKHSSRAQNVTLDILVVRCDVSWLEERPHALATGIRRATMSQKPCPVETNKTLGDGYVSLITNQILRLERSRRSSVVSLVARKQTTSQTNVFASGCPEN